MNNFQLSPELDNNKVFLIKRSELEGRFDCEYYIPLLKDNIERIKKLSHFSLRDKINTLQTGYNNKQNNSIGVPFLRTQNVRAIWIDTSNTTFTNDKVIRISKYGDLLFTRIGVNVGDVGYNDIGDVAISDNVILARLSDIKLARFCAIFLATDIGRSFIEREKRNTARAIISYENVKNILIPDLHSADLLSIIKKMDSAYATKKQKESEAQRLLDGIENYLLGELGIELPEQEENTLQSRTFTRQLSEISGGRFDPIFYSANLNKFISGKYKSTKIGSLANRLISGVGAGKQDQATEINGVIQIRPTNIDTNGGLKYDKNVFLPSKSKFIKVQVNDVLFNNTNSQELVGKTSILKENKELYFSNHITKITVNKSKISPDYLTILLNTYQRNRIFYSICTNWNNQSGVGLDLFKSLEIPVPPLEKQTEIADHITEIRNQAKQLQQQAKDGLAQAKKEVEALILGTDEVKT